MRESDAMLEIRRIRDENSRRHLSMTQEEITQEMDASVGRFLKELGKSVPIIGKDQQETVA